MGSLTKFFLLAYAIAWTFFIAAIFTGRPAVFVPGIFAPVIVALWLTARAEGWPGARALLRRVLLWRAGWQLYAFAIGYMAAIKLAVALAYRLARGAWPHFGNTAWYVMVAAIVISTPFQAGEEIGWRGYALPRLAARFGFANASILLGVIWACWHLPQFFVTGADTLGQSFPLFLIEVTALSVALAWLYVRTNGSLLLTMLMHSAVNQTKDIVPSAVAGATNPFALSTSLVAWLTAALLWICAGYFLVRMTHRERGRLARSGRASRAAAYDSRRAGRSATAAGTAALPYLQRVTASIVTSSPGGVSPM